MVTEKSNEGLIDLPYLRQRFTEVQVREILESFITHAAATLSDMKSAVANKDPVLLAACAHKVRGSALTVTAKGIAQLCGNLEVSVGELNWESAGQISEMLVTAVKELEDFLRESSLIA